MSSSRLLSSLLSLGILTVSSGALAQAKPAAPAPPQTAPKAAQPQPAQAKSAQAPPELPPPSDPASDEDAPEPSAEPSDGAPPVPVRAMETDRGALPKSLQSAVPPGAFVEPARPAPREEAEPPPPAPETPYLQRFSLGIGFRGVHVTGPGFDPYSNNDTLPTASVFGTFTPWDLRPVSFHLVGEWDFGSSTAEARGLPTKVTMHRAALGLQARYMPITRMAFLARVVPAALHVSGEIEDSYLGDTLQAASWTWGVDVTGGAAVRVGAVGTNQNPKVSFWLALDLGYRFAGATAMRFSPGDLGEEDQTRRFGEVPLADLDLSGFIGRFSFSVAF